MNIQSIIGKASISFTFCPNLNCNKKFVEWFPNQKYEWAIDVRCNCSDDNDNKKWYICTTCDKQRTFLQSERQLATHHRCRHHLIKTKRIGKRKREQEEDDSALLIGRKGNKRKKPKY